MRSANSFGVRLSTFLLVVFLGRGAERTGARHRFASWAIRAHLPQSKSAVEKALKTLQPSMSGRLPALEGFAVPGDHPLSRYQRAYYESSVRR
jgi:type III secretory pathway component EscT